MTGELITTSVRQIHSICPYNCVASIDNEVKKVNGIQEIKFRHYNFYPAPMKEVEGPKRMKFEVMIVIIDGKKYGPEFIKTLCKNEGYDDLLDFHMHYWPMKNFKGQVIHYTDFRYK